jgi:hypothetical protein
MLDEATRVRQVQEVLREVNERLAAMDWAEIQIDFLCECGATDCVDVVKLTLDEYAARSKAGPLASEGHAASLT